MEEFQQEIVKTQLSPAKIDRKMVNLRFLRPAFASETVASGSSARPVPRSRMFTIETWEPPLVFVSGFREKFICFSRNWLPLAIIWPLPVCANVASVRFWPLQARNHSLSVIAKGYCCLAAYIWIFILLLFKRIVFKRAS